MNALTILSLEGEDCIWEANILGDERGACGSSQTYYNLDFHQAVELMNELKEPFCSQRVSSCEGWRAMASLCDRRSVVGLSPNCYEKMIGMANKRNDGINFEHSSTIDVRRLKS